MIDLDAIEKKATAFLARWGKTSRMGHEIQSELERSAQDIALVEAVRAAQRETASHRHVALLAAGIHGGPHAWRWASDPTGTILGDVAAWERLLGEMRERAASPTPAIYCPNCEATGFPPSGHAWPSLEPWWIDGAKLCCTECGACLVVRADGEGASLELDEPEPAERKPVAGWANRKEHDGAVSHILHAGPFICWATVDPDNPEVSWCVEGNGGLHREADGAGSSLADAQIAAEDAAHGLLADAINALRGGL